MAEEITDVELEIIKDLVERLSRLQEEYESLVKLKGLRDDEREDIDYIRKTNEKVIELLSDLQAYIISHDKLSDDIDELNEMLIYTRR
jgi:benzoyl-CoA reductase/2-hydroxyglutaryl-CoA dehydratase subunit BcrC/BadD/HgdB